MKFKIGDIVRITQNMNNYQKSTKIELIITAMCIVCLLIAAFLPTSYPIANGMLNTIIKSITIGFAFWYCFWLFSPVKSKKK